MKIYIQEEFNALPVNERGVGRSQLWPKLKQQQNFQQD